FRRAAWARPGGRRDRADPFRGGGFLRRRDSARLEGKPRARPAVPHLRARPGLFLPRRGTASLGRRAGAAPPGRYFEPDRPSRPAPGTRGIAAWLTLRSWRRRLRPRT